MSCLFNSLSAFVGEPAQQIRGRICDFLATDAALYEDLSASVAVHVESGKTLSVYVNQMRSPAQWGGAIEIRSFVLLWKRPVNVWDIRKRRWIEFPSAGDSGADVNISWTGGHYEPMRGSLPPKPVAAPVAPPPIQSTAPGVTPPTQSTAPVVTSPTQTTVPVAPSPTQTTVPVAPPPIQSTVPGVTPPTQTTVPGVTSPTQTTAPVVTPTLPVNRRFFGQRSRR